MCRIYGGSTGAARGGLRILGGQRNLGGFLYSVFVVYGWRNLGVSILRRCRVSEVCFWGGLRFFLDSVR